MVTLVLTWGMQQESFLAWNIGAPDPYPLLLGRGGGLPQSKPPGTLTLSWHGAMSPNTKLWVACLGP